MRSLRIVLMVIVAMYAFFFMRILSLNPVEPVVVPGGIAHNLIENFNIPKKSIIIDSRKVVGIVFSDGNYYLCSDDGSLIASVSSKEFFKFYPLFLEVKLEGLQLSREEKKILNFLKPILKSSLVSAVFFKSRKVTLIKGVTVSFKKWQDLANNFRILETQIDLLEPKSEYFLADGGILIKIRGD
ncbi:DUF4894 domain-containing protein [Thermotoga sp.]|uniref:DUF4894 domain-containing protein n=1 Tax=Thermotoga sp. TaxID=28240 RepID=UPI0025F1E5A2|nr:DUF4894 domain-containing protein [Thermotoga sp.]MCD6552318.1 DUF4894 domain-containing protein [Thermotoga sp.]